MAAGFFVFTECKEDRHEDCVKFIPRTPDRRVDICRCECHFHRQPDGPNETPFRKI